jgi:hypothetical protein
MRLRSMMLASVLCLASQAQVSSERTATGGGELRIGNTAYHLTLTEFSTALPKGGLPGAVRFRGTLTSVDGKAPWFLNLTVLKNGTLYLLSIQRPTHAGNPDIWNATLKTRVRFLKRDDRLGGRTELQCEGPLTGVIGQKQVSASWSGTLWALQPGG